MRHTIVSVAKDLGLAPSTVSKAINNTGHISEATRKRVLDYVDEIGFVPNSSARILKSRRSYLIGLIYQDHKALILGEIPIHIIPKLDKVKSIADLPPLNTISINPNTAIKTTLDENIEGHMGEMKHYRLSIEEAGKYIIGFHLENTSSLLSQTSFNLYFDQYYEQTFTYNQFSGTLWANAYKILKKGEYVFSIKFNQSGLKVHTLTIQRHP